MKSLLRTYLRLVLYSATDKVWKLADFGLSSDRSGYRSVRDEYAYGPSGYRAPELMDELSSFTNKSDIWALGCIIFELLTGVRAFTSDYAVMRYSNSGEVEIGNMRDAVDRYLAGFRLDLEDGQWMSTRLVSTLSVDPTARPTASELKGVFHTLLNAIPAAQRQGSVN